jgi:hypothetical protein
MTIRINVNPEHCKNSYLMSYAYAVIFSILKNIYYTILNYYPPKIINVYIGIFREISCFKIENLKIYVIINVFYLKK